MPANKQHAKVVLKYIEDVSFKIFLVTLKVLSSREILKINARNNFKIEFKLLKSY